MSDHFLVLDFETDPFEHGNEVNPFVWDIFDGNKHYNYWGEDCVEQLIKWLKERKTPSIIYAHNGGKFDFMFLLPWIRGENMLVIGTRIVQASLFHHTIRDSFAAIPVPLSAMEKGEIDYEKMRHHRRWQNRKEIMKYLFKDTESLHKYMGAYREMFGSKAVTMAGAAIKSLTKFHHYEVMPESTDGRLREYFHGGRVECFKAGVGKLKGKVFDVNSMYPSVMRNFLHPISATPLPGNRVVKKTCFVHWRGESFGAMPVRTNDEVFGYGLNFPHGQGEFKCTIHEFIAGLETGTIKVDKVLATWDFLEQTKFDKFIDHFYKLRCEARDGAVKDEVNALFYKLVMNSAYGKFAQNPREFCDYEFTDKGDTLKKKHCECKNWKQCTCDGWIFATEPGSSWQLWKRLTKPKGFTRTGFHNVATAASITGAARSLLLRAIVSADTPLYCDTDSLICKSLTGVKIDSKELGAWKLEKEFDEYAIAGKKHYSLFKKGVCVKSASKGWKGDGDQIRAIANGGEVEYHNMAPTMKFDGSQQFITRKIRNTAKIIKVS